MVKRNEEIAKHFNNIYRRYDIFNHISSLFLDKWWRKKTVDSISQCNLVLDVAVGSGELALTIFKKQKTDSIVGIDISEKMLEIGKNKFAQTPFANKIKWINANALNIPFTDATFDAVVCGFGIRNFSNPKLGLAEMYRVLKNNGELVILEFSHPKNKLFSFLYDFYFRYVLIPLGYLLTNNKDTFCYFYNSVKQFMNNDQLVALLQTIGFKQITYFPLSLGICTIYKAIK